MTILCGELYCTCISGDDDNNLTILYTSESRGYWAINSNHFARKWRESWWWRLKRHKTSPAVRCRYSQCSTQKSVCYIQWEMDENTLMTILTQVGKKGGYIIIFQTQKKTTLYNRSRSYFSVWKIKSSKKCIIIKVFQPSPQARMKLDFAKMLKTHYKDRNKSEAEYD